MNKKILLGVVSIVIVILIVYLTSLIKPVPVAEEQAYIQPSQQIGTETPATEGDVTNQPAYLIDAYSKNGKDYIDVDYVEWLYGEASIQAQTEDGECSRIGDDNCYDYPNGYKRNRNPKVRTLEVSPAVSIEINGGMGLELVGTTAPEETLVIPFKQFADITAKINYDFASNVPPFKDAKDFITIDVKDNFVTNITEPYQE